MFRMGTGECFVVLCVAMLFMGPKQMKVLVRRWSETMRLLKDEAAKLDQDPPHNGSS
jgi:Sec-independent protein translocase protein TatA